MRGELHCSTEDQKKKVQTAVLPLFGKTTSSPHFSSGIVERAKCERAWKSPHARKARRRGVVYYLARALSYVKTGNKDAHIV